MSGFSGSPELESAHRFEQWAIGVCARADECGKLYRLLTSQGHSALSMRMTLIQQAINEAVENIDTLVGQTEAAKTVATSSGGRENGNAPQQGALSAGPQESNESFTISNPIRALILLEIFSDCVARLWQTEVPGGAWRFETWVSLQRSWTAAIGKAALPAPQLEYWKRIAVSYVGSLSDDPEKARSHLAAMYNYGDEGNRQPQETRQVKHTVGVGSHTDGMPQSAMAAASSLAPAHADASGAIPDRTGPKMTEGGAGGVQNAQAAHAAHLAALQRGRRQSDVSWTGHPTMGSTHHAASVGHSPATASGQPAPQMVSQELPMGSSSGGDQAPMTAYMPQTGYFQGAVPPGMYGYGAMPGPGMTWGGAHSSGMGMALPFGSPQASAVMADMTHFAMAQRGTLSAGADGQGVVFQGMPNVPGGTVHAELNQSNGNTLSLPNAPRRKRLSFPPEKLNRLETEFRQNPLAPRNVKQELARELELTYKQVDKWFDNRRAKQRRIQREGASDTPPSPQGRSSTDT